MDLIKRKIPNCPHPNPLLWEREPELQFPFSFREKGLEDEGL
jgi:hypothetical protein